jgi:hypothetical protein
MNFIEFSKKWIAKNVPASDLYGNRIQKFVMELAETFSEQHHSGASAATTLHYFKALMDAYDKQGKP